MKKQRDEQIKRERMEEEAAMNKRRNEEIMKKEREKAEKHRLMEIQR